MRRATRLVLRLFWLLIPVTIAACYGPQVRYPPATCALPDGGTGSGADCAKAP